MGGPEKPISALGMKSYKRYWAAEIARWLLKNYEDSNKNYKKGDMLTITVNTISQGTWIHPDDVLETLREMNFVARENEKGPKCIMSPDAIEKYLHERKISIQKVVDEDGFLPGYAEKKAE